MGKTILYLEDEASTRTALTYILQHEGHVVHAYGSAEEALPHLQNGGIDLALLDVRLPGRFGDDFGREMKEKHPGMAVLFLTAEADADKVKQIVPDSMVLRKPVDISVLVELIKCLPQEAGAGEPPASLPFSPPAAG